MKRNRNKISGFFMEEYGKLVSYVRRWIDDTADRDAEDIVQEVFTGLFDRTDFTVPVENLSAYVYRSLKNKVIDVFRRKKNIVSLEAGVSPGSDMSLADLLHDVTADTVSEAEAAQCRDHLYDAIAGLNPADRAVVIANEIEGRSFRVLSEEWGVPIGTLLARKSRALKKIKKELAGWG